MKLLVIIMLAILFLNSSYSQKKIKNEQNLYGVKNQKGEVVLEASFDYVEDIKVNMPLDVATYYSSSQTDPNKRYIKVVKGDKQGIYTLNGKMILPVINKYVKTKMSTDSLVVFRNENNKLSFINLKTKEIITSDFKFLEDFYGGLAQVTEQNGKRGYIDKTGKLLIPCKYEFTYPFSDGVAIVQNGSKKGYINTEGKEITSIKYDDAKNFSHGVGIINIGGKWHKQQHFYGGKNGLVNAEGKVIGEIKYDLIKHLQFLDNNQIAVNIGAAWNADCKCIEGGKWAIFDYLKEKEVTPFNFNGIWKNEDLENVYLMKIEDKYGLINEKGETIVPAAYHDMSYIRKLKRFRVTANDLHGLIDESGKIIVPVEYEMIYYNSFTNEIQVKKNGRKFFIDKMGNELK